MALWLEGLLAQAVLRGKTKGYVHHPQLIRFRQATSPLGAIAGYLRAVHEEAACRGYRFDASRISGSRASGRLVVTRVQLEFEWEHLREKLRARDPRRHQELEGVERPEPHPLFRGRRGPLAAWEKGGSGRRPARTRGG